MEGREKSGRSGDFEDAAEMTLVWSRCQEDFIVDMMERIEQNSEAQLGGSYTIVLEVDVLIPRDAWPVISWQPTGRASHECVISMGVDHWEFISKGASSFVRTTMNSLKTKISDDAEISTVKVKERTSNVVWTFHVVIQHSTRDLMAQVVDRSFRLRSDLPRTAYLGTGGELNVHPLRGDGPYDEDNLGGTMPGADDMEEME